MATTQTQYPTLLDVANQTDPDGNTSDIAELLSQTNEILMDMPFFEANDRTKHTSTVRAGLPQATFRKLYGFTQPSKSTSAQVEDSMGMLEAYSGIDPKLASMSADAGKFLLNESRAHIEGMSQTMATTLFYGNTDTDPEKFMGLAPRYNDETAANADNIIDGGGDGSDNSSIWLVGWGEGTVFGIYPKGSKAGISMEDLGKVQQFDANGGVRQLLMQHYMWDAGIVVKDWRYVVRIANIDKSELLADASGSSANLHELFFKARAKFPSMANVRIAAYMPRDIHTMIGLQASQGVKQSSLKTENVGGTVVDSIHGIPLRRVDALAADEAGVTFS